MTESQRYLPDDIRHHYIAWLKKSLGNMQSVSQFEGLPWIPGDRGSWYREIAGKRLTVHPSGKIEITAVP